MTRLLTIAAAMAAFSLAQPASAAIMQGTIGGTITYGTDSLNLFGGGSLVSKAVALSYSYDSALFSSNPYGICGASDACNISRTAAALTVATTIGGTTRTDTSGPVAEVDFFANGPTVSLYPTLPPNNGVYNYTILNLTLSNAGQIGQSLSPAFGPSITDRLSFTVDNQTEFLTFTPSVSAVPLPASLPLFGAALLTLVGLRFGATRRSSAS
ncbi:hypothetical protein [Lichenifustis flavocetrariae]|uniref:VPLPA-CTERM sorting domain-containing protein n=1 Tax=Lichenifustis flavocetrariae TaxID=2949735 RepID=A0AA42CL65_9HYPH|nr:hypothetical protein [Lichenifustis flavocetrariae]MCW6511299.1 hypothetical protein [Lichenifustis flavocetrariae]